MAAVARDIFHYHQHPRPLPALCRKDHTPKSNTDGCDTTYSLITTNGFLEGKKKKKKRFLSPQTNYAPKISYNSLLFHPLFNYPNSNSLGYIPCNEKGQGNTPSPWEWLNREWLDLAPSCPKGYWQIQWQHTAAMLTFQCNNDWVPAPTLVPRLRSTKDNPTPLITC